MDTSTYQKRYITAIIGIGTGQLGAGAPAKFYTLSDHRMSAEISAYGGETQGEATVRIYGMSQALMDQLTSIGPVQWQIRGNNSIQILAGTDPNALATIYNGTIQTAYADYNTSPDVSFEITAMSASVAAMKPVDAYSSPINVPVTVEQVMRDLAIKAGLTWGVNVDVNEVVSNITLNGSAFDQIKSLADSIPPNGIDATIDNFTLSIKHKTSSYPGAVPVISPSTGMVGYPKASQQYMFVKSLFNPAIKFGGQITVAGSQAVGANGTWIVAILKHELESLMPNGNWYTTCGVFPNVFTG